MATPPAGRKLGIAVVIALTVLVAALQFLSGRGHQERSLDRAFAELAQAELQSGKPRQEHVAKAQAAFARATAVVSLEPQALIGAAVTEKLADRWGQVVELPKPVTQLTDEEAAAYLRALLECGRVREADQTLREPAIARRRGELEALTRFVERWRAAQATLAGGGSGDQVR